MKITTAILYIAILASINSAFAQEPGRHREADAAVVVDSLGKRVGPYFPVFPLGTFPSDSVLLRINQTLFLLFVSPAGFTAEDNPLYYSNASCSGTPYLPIPSHSNSLGSEYFPFAETPGFYALVGGVLYYTRTGATPQSIPSGSYQVPGSTTCVVASSLGSLFAPAEAFDLSILGFVPPFRIVLR